MGLMTPRKSTLASRIGLLWPLFCALLLLPATGFAVCGTAPTVSFDKAGKYSAAGESVDYIVSITNNDAGSCDLDLSVSGDVAGFSSTLPNGTPLTVAGGATDSTTILRVSVTGGTADWLLNTTTLSVDAVDSVATTTVFDNDPLLHNSINMGSTKHSGNWGSTKTGSKYGNFSCQTCHVQGTNNIKRIRTSITTPDNTFGNLPGNGMPISFQSVVDGSADLGDDSRADKTQSSAICETCHTYDAAGTNGVRYHGYNMSGPGNVGHYNKKDCLLCHPHSAGFKASCASCHGGGTLGTIEANYWPDGSSAAAENDQVGRHLEHMDALAQLVYGLSAADLLNDAAADAKQKAICAFCHDTPGADGDHTTAGAAEVAMHPVWNVGAAASGSYTSGDGNCTNICHNNKATGVDDEPGGAATWGWNDTATSTCIMCHNDITADGNTTGETHNDHINAANKFGRTIVCADCHDAATNWGTGTPPAANHIDGDFDISGVVTLVYADANTPPGTDFGGCGTNACHNNGQGGVPANSGYQWNSNNLADCSICHSDLPTSNAHAKHVQTAEAAYGAGTAWPAGNNSSGITYDFSCVNCHGTTKSNHLNGSVTVSGVGYVDGSADATPNGTCATAACHKDGTSPVVYKETPAWTDNFIAGACDGCHGNFPTTAAHPQHTLEVSFHYDAIYSGLEDFLPVVDADLVPAGLTGAIDNLRGHGNPALEDAGVATAIVSCNTCHNYTITVNTNKLATYADGDAKTKACGECHNAANPTITAGTSIIAVADTAYHVNGTTDIKFMEQKIRSKAQLRDEKVYTSDGSGKNETAWTQTNELTNNWDRYNGYKAIDGSSYDEQPETLHQMALNYKPAASATYYIVDPADEVDDGFGNPILAAKTCMVSCHLWEANRVDKLPVHWVDNATDGTAPLICIDCHSRLPK